MPAVGQRPEDGDREAEAALREVTRILREARDAQSQPTSPRRPLRPPKPIVNPDPPETKGEQRLSNWIRRLGIIGDRIQVFFASGLFPLRRNRRKG